MSFLKKLFGSAPTPPQDMPSEEYKGFSITPTPQQDGNQFRLCARIEKEIDGEVKTHTLIRADTMADREEVAAISLQKAKQVIDEQGDKLFRTRG